MTFKNFIRYVPLSYSDHLPHSQIGAFCQVSHEGATVQMPFMRARILHSGKHETTSANAQNSCVHGRGGGGGSQSPLSNDVIFGQSRSLVHHQLQSGHDPWFHGTGTDHPAIRINDSEKSSCKLLLFWMTFYFGWYQLLNMTFMQNDKFGN